MLNATLMLAIMLGIVLIIIISQVNGLVEDTSHAIKGVLEPQIARLDRIGNGIEILQHKINNSKLEAPKLKAITFELKHLNEQLSKVNTSVKEAKAIPRDQIIAKLIEQIANKLKQ
jgi:hypothetical protein